jgi:hypothetical protein
MALDFSSSSGPSIGAAPVSVNGSYDRNVFSGQAAAIIKNHSQTTGDQPLYLYVAFQSVCGRRYLANFGFGFLFFFLTSVLFVNPPLQSNVHDACTSDRYKNGLQAPKASVDLYATTTLDTWKVQAAMTTGMDDGRSVIW